MSTAGLGVLPKITEFYPSSDRIIEINAWTLESGTWRWVLQWTNIPPTPAANVWTADSPTSALTAPQAVTPNPVVHAKWGRAPVNDSELRGKRPWYMHFIFGVGDISCCRQDISPMWKLPIQTGFDPPDIPCLLWDWNPAIRMLFWLDFQKYSRICCQCLIKSSLIMWFWWWYSHVSSCLGGWETEIILFLLIIILIRNPPRAPGRIIHLWKGISKRNTTPLRS